MPQEVSFVTSAFQSEQFPPADRPEIAFAGRSNVGKSSLINKLVGRKNLAKISARPGRTRSINFFSVENFLYLADLPGYGYAAVSQKMRQSWKRLVEAYLTTRPNLKAVVLIIDIRRGPEGADIELLNWLRAYEIRTVIVLTKADKVSRGRAKQRVDLILQQFAEGGVDRPLIFSAKTGQGKSELWSRIQEAIEG
ncbi:MAG: YihA family ribosome biogenesis GTP-binding protein [Deltaproteobacteria bacterium]|nr:MAG: YihA family ribosome biogenesis GTP-binding protein [Deltaproteobacteria bacterium]